MSVLDASAMVEALVGRDPDEQLLSALAEAVSAPHLLDVEVMSVLRGLSLARKLDEAAARDAWGTYQAFAIDRYDFEPLAARVWQLRHQFTGYDATYLALAEALDQPLLTCDAKLATTGHNAEVHVLGRTD